MEQGVYPLFLDGERAGEVRVSAEGAWTGSMYDAGGLWPALGAALAWPYGVYAGFGAMKEVVR